MPKRNWRDRAPQTIPMFCNSWQGRNVPCWRYCVTHDRLLAHFNPTCSPKGVIAVRFYDETHTQTQRRIEANGRDSHH